MGRAVAVAAIMVSMLRHSERPDQATSQWQAAQAYPRGWWFGDTFTGVPVRIKNRASAAKAGAVRLPDCNCSMLTLGDHNP